MGSVDGAVSAFVCIRMAFLVTGSESRTSFHPKYAFLSAPFLLIFPFRFIFWLPSRQGGQGGAGRGFQISPTHVHMYTDSALSKSEHND